MLTTISLLFSVTARFPQTQEWLEMDLVESWRKLSQKHPPLRDHENLTEYKAKLWL